MFKIICILLFIFCMFSSQIIHAFSKSFTDSTGILNNKQYVKHKVNNGETINSLSKKYNTSTKSIKEANPRLKNWIYVGQVLQIPVVNAPKIENQLNVKSQSGHHEKNNILIPEDSDGINLTSFTVPAIYKVTGNEFLSDVAVQYNTTVQHITEWNDLTSETLENGQEIVVGWLSIYDRDSPPNLFIHSASKNEIKDAQELNNLYKASIQSTTTADSAKSAILNIQQSEKITNPATNENKKQIIPVKKSPKKKTKAVVPLSAKEIAEDGIGITATIDQLNIEKSYALYSKVPTGTIIKVINPLNEKFTFVKVVGKMPENMNEYSIMSIMLSPFAVKNIGIEQQNRFEVKLSYGIVE